MTRNRKAALLGAAAIAIMAVVAVPFDAYTAAGKASKADWDTLAVIGETHDLFVATNNFKPLSDALILRITPDFANKAGLRRAALFKRIKRVVLDPWGYALPRKVKSRAVFLDPWGGTLKARPAKDPSHFLVKVADVPRSACAGLARGVLNKQEQLFGVGDLRRPLVGTVSIGGKPALGQNMDVSTLKADCTAAGKRTTVIFDEHFRRRMD